LDGLGALGTQDSDSSVKGFKGVVEGFHGCLLSFFICFQGFHTNGFGFFCGARCRLRSSNRGSERLMEALFGASSTCLLFLCFVVSLL
jgi:hypothetical protein